MPCSGAGLIEALPESHNIVIAAARPIVHVNADGQTSLIALAVMSLWVVADADRSP